MRIAVEGGGFDTAAEAFVTGNQLAAITYKSLTASLGGYGAMAGDDATSTEFGAGYDSSAREATAAYGDLVDAFASLAELTASSVDNHRRANTGSVFGKPLPTYDGSQGLANSPVDVSGYTPPTSVGGDNEDLPDQWNLIADHLQGFAWPNADTGRLRAAARTWADAAVDVARLADYCDMALKMFEGQHSPEIPIAEEATGDLRRAIADLSTLLGDLGQACDDYASDVEHHRGVIRGILKDFAIEAGISLTAGAIVGIFTVGSGAAAGAGVAAWRAVSAARKVVHALTALRAAAKLKAVARLASVASRIRPLRAVLARFRRARQIRDAAHTVKGARSIARSHLNPSQLANLSRYTKKLPRGAEKTIVSRLPNGTVVYTTRVPGRVPGSYAEYRKMVNEAGDTVGYIKKTYGAEGKIIHIKDKMPQ